MKYVVNHSYPERIVWRILNINGYVPSPVSNNHIISATVFQSNTLPSTLANPRLKPSPWPPMPDVST